MRAATPATVARLPRSTFPPGVTLPRQRGGCNHRKRQYSSREAAVSAAAGCMRRVGLLRVYQCPGCGWYFLTSQPKRGGQA